jgi:hypothetical protein
MTENQFNKEQSKIGIYQKTIVNNLKKNCHPYSNQLIDSILYLYYRAHLPCSPLWPRTFSNDLGAWVVGFCVVVVVVVVEVVVVGVGLVVVILGQLSLLHFIWPLTHKHSAQLLGPVLNSWRSRYHSPSWRQEYGATIESGSGSAGFGRSSSGCLNGGVTGSGSLATVTAN